MKIQETTVVETGPESAQIELVVADHEDIEQAKQYVVCSVLVSSEAKPPLHDPIALRILQIRALKEAIALLGRAEDGLSS